VSCQMKSHINQDARSVNMFSPEVQRWHLVAALEQRLVQRSSVSLPEQYGPTEVQFDRPLPEGLQGTLYRNGPD